MVICKDKNLIKRVLEISYNKKISHLGSYFSSLGILDNIFAFKEKEDIVILSSGHAALSLYCVLEKYHNINAEMLFDIHGGHPHLDEKNHIYCSTGSLGMGITVAIGRSLANKNRTVHCIISDGECAEGSVWESLRFIKEQKINNIKIYCNINGYCAYDEIDEEYLITRLKSFYPDIIICKTNVEQFPFLKGLNAHYHIMKENDYNLAIESLK